MIKKSKYEEIGTEKKSIFILAQVYNIFFKIKEKLKVFKMVRPIVISVGITFTTMKCLYTNITYHTVLKRPFELKAQEIIHGDYI